MTASELRSCTVRDLVDMAKKNGVQGWHGMRKEQLVKALSVALRRGKAKSSGSPSRRSTAKTSKSATAKKNNSRPAAARKSSSGSKRKSDAGIQRRIRQLLSKQWRNKDLSTDNGKGSGAVGDRLVLMVRDPFWLHAHWELTHRGVERAKVALGQEWHTARPVLRLFALAGRSTTGAAERVLQDLTIHGGVNNWYVNVDDPPQTYRMEIGYLSAAGRFYALARSNVVTTPRPGVGDNLEEPWTRQTSNLEKIYALSGGKDPEGPGTELQELFDERLRRPSGPLVVPNSDGKSKRKFNFQIDAELIVYGATEPDAKVTLQGEPVELRPDGTFTVRYALPDCRQVIPAVAYSNDGVEQRTTVLAIERNTKTMEPVTRDRDNGAA